ALSAERGEEIGRLREALGQLEAGLVEAQRDSLSMKETLRRATAEAEARGQEAGRLREELSLLESEKRDLVLDVQERVKGLQEATQEVKRQEEVARQAEDR
ncbi:unnamed protein product, partial [Discosporangium mesarthrocarpum]